MEAATASGIKRSPTESAQSSISNQTPISGNSGPLVYARRKSEQELAPKPNNCEKEKKGDCGQQVEEETLPQEVQSESAAAAPVTSGEPSPFLVKPCNQESSGEANTCSGDQHWKERLLRLQTHLRNCDSSSQLEYIKMLQNLTPVGRSKHAVELEKRAIQLLLEEGHELMRMKHLNVLGKSVPTQLRMEE